MKKRCSNGSKRFLKDHKKVSDSDIEIYYLGTKSISLWTFHTVDQIQIYRIYIYQTVNQNIFKLSKFINQSNNQIK